MPENPPSHEKPRFLAPLTPISLLPAQLTDALAGLDHYTDPNLAVKLWQRELDRPRFVYFIGEKGDPESPLKIGEAFDPYRRMRSLQTGNWREFELRAIVLAAEDTEKRLHKRWWTSRMRGEWFGGGEHLRLLELALDVQRRQIEAFESGHRDFYSLALMAWDIAPTDKRTWFA